MSVDKTLQESKRPASWCWEASLSKLHLSDRFATYFNCIPKELPCDSKNEASFFTSTQISDLQQALQNFTENGTNQIFTHHTSHQVTGKSERVLLKWRGEVTGQNNKGEPLFISGFAQQVSDPESTTLSYRNQALLFQELMKNLPGSIFFKDREGKFLTINDACANKFGLDGPEEAIGKTDFDFFDKKYAQDAFNDEQQVMSTENPIINKVEKEILEHEERWASTTRLPLYDETGNVIGLFGITRDITTEEQTKTRLKHNAEIIEKLSKQVPGFFYMYHHISDDDACFPFASHGIRDIYELNPDEVKETTEPIIDRIHKDDLEEVVHTIKKSTKTLEPWESEYRVILPEKGLRWLRGRAKPEKQPDGTVMGYGYITDITDEKNNFEAIARLQNQLQQIIDSAPNLIFVKDIDGVFLMANESAASFFGENVESIVGKTDTELGVSNENAELYLEIEKEVLQQDEPRFIPEDKTIMPDGSDAWHQTTKVPFLNTDSGKPAVLSIVTDITRRKQKEMELSETLNIIGQQNQRLMNFAHIVSHNLRNHAGNISMLLSLYEMEDSEVEQDELMEHMNVASERLNESIADLNEIIDKQHQTKDDLKEINFRDQFLKVKEILTTEILNNQVKIEEDIPADLSLTYNPAYLESILLNLLSNAIKYRHPDRRPIIKVRAFERDERYHFEISDNGLGIDLGKHRDKLFGMYNTFHQNKNSKGIGLFITKNQIESMGGSIEVESKPNHGTTFKIVLK